MQKKSLWWQFWNIFGPMIIKTVIEIGVSIVASTLMLMVNFKEYLDVALSGNQKALMDFVVRQTNEVLAYSEHITIAAAACVIPIMLFWFYMDEKRRKSAGAAGKAKQGIGRFLLIIPFAGVAGIAFNNITLLANLEIVSEAYNEVSIRQYALPFGVQILAYGLIIPVCEELVYRGLVYKRMRDSISMKRAMICSALLFGVFHGNIVQTLYAMAMGMIFAYLYEMYGSLKAPILAHMVINTIVVVMTELGVFTWMFADLMRVGIVTVMCAAAGSSLFVFCFQKESFQKVQEQ